MTIRYTRRRTSAERKAALKNHLRSKKRNGGQRALNHEQLEQRQVMAGDVFQLIGIQNNDGDLLENNEILNSSPHNLTLRFDENHVIDPTTIAAGIHIYRAGDNNVLGDSDDVDILGNGAAFGGFIGIGDNPNEIVIRFGEALPDDQYRIEVTSDLMGTSTAGTIAAVESTTTFELNLGAQILSIVPQPVTRDVNGDLQVASDQIYIYLNNDDLDPTLAEDPGYYQLLFQRTSGGDASVQNGEVAFFPTNVSYDSDLDLVILTFSDSLDSLAASVTGYDPTAATVYRLQIGSKEITSKEWTDTLGVDTINTIGTANDAGDTFDTATDLVGPNSESLLDGNHEFEVTRAAYVDADGNGTADVVDQIFTVNDGAGHELTFQLTNNTSLLDPSYVAIDISALVTNLSSTRADLALAIANGIEAGFLNIAQTVDVSLATTYSSTRFKLTSPNGRPTMSVSDTTIGLIVDRSQTIVIHGEILNTTPYELNLPGASDEVGHREDYDDQQSHLNGSADDHTGITEFRYAFPVQYGTDPATGAALINAITEAQKQRTREIMALYSYYSGVTFVEVPYYEAYDLGVVTGDLRALDPTVPTGPGGVAGLAGGGLVIMDIFDHQNAGDDEYGAAWQSTAIHEIGHFLGLGHAYELPPLTDQSGGDNDFGLSAENIFPGDADIVHMQYLYNPESKDIDLYKLEITETGRLTAEILAERLSTPSSLDALITIYQENGDGTRTVIARNDDYYSEDSFVELLLEQGTYYIGVSASGNNAYDPTIPDSGFGGLTQGQYDLQIQFRPDSTNAIKDTGAELESGVSIQVRTAAEDFVTTASQFNDVGVHTITIVDTIGNTATYELDFVDDLSDPSTVTPGNIPVPVLKTALASEIVTALIAAIESTTDTLPNFKVEVADQVGNRIDLKNVAANNPVVFSSLIESLDTMRASGGAAEGVALDGDLDGVVGGNYNFWFRAETSNDANIATPLDEPVVIYVDKSSTRGGQNMPALDGTLQRPFNNIQDAITYAEQRNAFALANFGHAMGDVIRIVGNDQDLAYYIGYDTTQQRVLEDGQQLIIPQDVTVMIDEGAILKFGVGGAVVVGSTSVNEDRSFASLQVLGVPERFDPYVNAAGELVQDTERADRRVIFTSYNEDGVGDRSNLQFAPAAGDWGGVFFNNEVDREEQNGNWQDNGIFLNSIVGGDFRYGGGIASINGEDFTLAPVYMEETRPALYFNQIVASAGAAFSADPNSFEQTNFQVYDPTTGSYRSGEFNAATPDYTRSGPAIFGNDFVADQVVTPDTGDAYLEAYATNSLNGILVRINTPAGNLTEKLTVAANFDDTDIVHILLENLLIEGTPGGLYVDPFGELRARLDASLLIDPNIVIKSNGSRIEVQMGANLTAEGTSGNEVIFTSLHDDRYGFGGTFDTNGNGSVTTGQQGDWSGIYFAQTSTGSLDHVVLAFGGGNSRVDGGLAFFNAIEIHQATVRIANSLLEQNADGRGINDPGETRAGHSANATGTIFVAGAQPVIVNNNIRDNESAAININVNSLNKNLVVDYGRSTGFVDVTPGVGDNQGALIRYNLLTNNGLNGMIVRGGVLTTEGVWDDTDIVHILFDEIVIPDLHTYGGLRIESSSNESLVVKLLGDSAGITASGTPLDIEDRVGGTLQVVGQPGYPVVFTSLYDDTVGAGFDENGMSQTDTDNRGSAVSAGPGDWRSLLIDEWANDRNVDTIVESESNNAVSVGTNGTPQTSQSLGILAPDEYSGDDNRRLGFEVQGYLSSPSDVDVYSFQAVPGTEVWIDLDLTTYALDAIIELIDDNGNVIARSTDNNTLFGNNDAANQLNTMPKSGTDDEDHWTINPRDPSMRIVLPGNPTASVRNYHVRIRSNSDDLGTTQNASGSYLVSQDQLTGGLTSGVYQMQIRLRETDEFGGSTIKQADVRYATNGIEVIGQPAHSPLLGESAESTDNNNDTLGTAQDVGNVLTTDRDAISIAGNIASSTDVDWFQFDLTREYLQSIPGATADNLFASLILDIDYMGGTRGNSQLAVFDASGQLVLVSTDSNVSDDQVNTQFIANTAYDPDYTQLADLERGSLSTNDPYIGTIQIPQGTYYVAVSSSAQIPTQLTQFYQQNPTNPLVRLEPVDSIQRIVEEHIGGNASATAGAPDIAVFLRDQEQVVDYTLSDMVMFVSVDVGNALTRVYAVDPFTGAVVSYIGQFGYDVGDIGMHPDGSLYAYSIDTIGATTASQNGNFIQINTGTGAASLILDDGLQTYAYDVQNKTAVVDNGGAGYGFDFNALAYGYLSSTGFGASSLLGFAVGDRGGPSITDPTDGTNILYRVDATELDANGVARGTVIDANGSANDGADNNTNAGRAFNIGATDARAVGQIDTAFDALSPGSSTIILDPASTFDTNGTTVLKNYVDGDTFVLDLDGDPLTTADQIVVELNLGDELTFNSVNRVFSTSTVGGTSVTTRSGGTTILEGLTFGVGGDTYETVYDDFLDFNAVSNNAATSSLVAEDEGSVIKITDDNGVSLFLYLEDITDGNTADGESSATLVGYNAATDTKVGVQYRAGVTTRDELMNAVLKAIADNSSTTNTSATFAGSAYRSGNNIAVLGDSAITITAGTLATPGTFGGAVLDTQNPTANNAVVIDLAATETEFAAAVTAAINSTPTTTASQFGNRVTVIGTPASYANLAGLVTVSSNVTTNAGAVSVNIGAGSTAVEVADAIAAAVNAEGTFSADAVTAPGRITFSDGASTATATVIDANSLFQVGGVGSGGSVTGLAIMQGQLYAVDDNGGVFQLLNATGGGTLQADFLGTITDGGAPVQFVSLEAGPRIVYDNAYANILFGMSNTGKMYAIMIQDDGFGFNEAVLAPIFAGGQSSIMSAVTSIMSSQNVSGNITGVAMGTLNRNLWHTTGTRGLDAGHGIEVPVTGTRDAVVGGTSFYFGNEGATYLSGNATGNATTGNYDFPQGAHGSLITEDFSLEGYDATDLPVLYFNYFLATDNGNGPSTTDSFRVFIAGDDGNWQELATNNSYLLAGDGNDEYDETDKTTGEQRAVTINETVSGATTSVQQLYDNTGTWRQARIDLSKFAGMENLKLRFDFSTSGQMNIGGVAVDDGGNQFAADTSEIRALDSNKHDDGEIFSVTNPYDSQTYLFEINKGQTFTIGTFAQFNDGDQFTLTTADGLTTYTFEYDKNGDGVTGGNQAITLDVNDTPEDITRKIHVAVKNAFGGLVRVFRDGNEITIRDIENASRSQVSSRVVIDTDGSIFGMQIQGFELGQSSLGGAVEFIDIHDDRFVTEAGGITEQRISDETIAQIMRQRLHEVITPTVVDVAGNIVYENFPVHDEFVFMLAGFTVNKFNYTDSSGIAITSNIGLDVNLQADAFGVYTSNAGGQNNANQGVFIDDLIIGFAERGEMVTGASNNGTTFTTNPNASTVDNFLGQYQLELREGTEYTIATTGGRAAVTVWDTNDRLSSSNSIMTPSGAEIANNTRFEISDGVDTIVFRYWDLDAASLPSVLQDQMAGVYTIGYRTSMSEADIARALTTAINDTAGQKSRALTESTRTFGVIARVNSQVASATTRGQVDLSPKNPYTDEVIFGLLGTTNFGTPLVVEGNNDIVANATNTKLDGVTIPGYMEYHARGTIGDNFYALNPSDSSESGDIDMYRVELGLGNTIHVDVETLSLGSPLGTAIRLFYVDSGGTATEVASTGGTVLNYTVTNPALTGRYVVAVSLAANNVYDPTLTASDAGNGRVFSTEKLTYDLEVSVSDGYVNPFQNVTFSDDGDQNNFRDQGQIIISSNRVSYSEGWGILVDAAPRGSAADGGDNLPNQGAARVTRELNTARLATGVTIVNNIVFNNEVGAIRYSGDTSSTSQSPGSVPVGRIINNTLYGTGSGDIGILVDNQAGPTIVNNIVANFNLGISVANDGVSPTQTRISRTLFQDNNTNSTIGGAANNGQSPILLASGAPLFVNAAAGNFYLEAGSQAIDAAFDSIADRTEFNTLNSPLGIATSPVLAPARDQSGQLRYDDPTVVSSGGVGSSGFKDIGALDRADTRGPSGMLVDPQDNDAANLDLDQTLDVVQLLNGPLTNISIQLIDSSGLSTQPQGAGIDDTTVTSASFIVEKISGGVVTLLEEGVDYRFDYDATNNIIRLTPVSGVFEEGVTYKVTLKNRFTIDETTGLELGADDPDLIRDNAGNSIEPNKVAGNETSFFIRVGDLLDFGDAPDDVNAGGYATYVENDGARHQIREGFHLGAGIDSELNGSPNADATGDNFDDGVSFELPSSTSSGTLEIGKTNTIYIEATVPLNETNYGFAQVWIDLDGSGTFEESEMVINKALTINAINGSNAGQGQAILFQLDANAVEGETFMRVRYSSTGGLLSTGLAIDGEVEDYAITLTSGPPNPWHRTALPAGITPGDTVVSSHDLAAILYELDHREYTNADGSFMTAYDPEQGFTGDPMYTYGVPNYLDANNDNAVTEADYQVVLMYLLSNQAQFNPELVEDSPMASSVEIVNPAIENTPLIVSSTSSSSKEESTGPITSSFVDTSTPLTSSTSTISSNPTSQPTIDLFGLSVQSSKSSVTTLSQTDSTSVSYDDVDESFSDDVLLDDSLDAVLQSVAYDVNDAWRLDGEDSDEMDDLIVLLSEDQE
ncbi:GEVED domain-containing protein [Blastopirellula marina]|uniref:GEVED domain-containing protein n=1 Tax=Blastopirellula marina TaxID=124 RepID=A0A2S8GJT2_9BACT|nr:GEVED domain-containing protein [Blastopirellula marina]PQO44703.1 hypothetical protein C5Y93_18235 [Blastopirellula marina]